MKHHVWDTARLMPSEESRRWFFQPQRLKQFVKALGCTPIALVGPVRNDQFVLHRVFSADQLGDADLVAVRFGLQAAQHLGDVAAELAPV